MHAKTREKYLSMCKNACMGADWEDIKTVLCLIEGGSLAKAGEMLGVNYTTVARRITRIERTLGQQLFLKAKSGYKPTEAGLQVGQTARRMDEHNSELQRSLLAREDVLSGVLTITVPPLLVGPFLTDVFAAFKERYPNVELNIRATNHALDLNKPEADIAIRISNTPDETLVGQRLARQRSASFASVGLAKMLRETPTQPIPWVGLLNTKGAPKASLRNYPNAEIVYRFDDMSAILGAVQSGLGVARMPMFLGQSDGVVQLPILQPQPYWDIWVLTHADLRKAPKVRAFKDLLIPYFKRRAADFWGEDCV
ncbi:LysR family transcriptional regulator [Amylibacter sp. SFDW26]|uniref:LysR family transcriptional regulator n=1 Tax=Amylibacter sp. SFDW26 TaxID=2652722 RepID=UPI0012617D34|nr:LysR family transcriptional regulator [Amylibacter sp. SFDW26]KAB7614297.1 LysR family transcriptional regulator [Amylibacter sp. SFDW26]